MNHAWLRGRVAGSVARFRRPAPPGGNRCVPCTAINLGIASLASLGAAVLVEPVAGVAVAVASVLAIYRYGYLVPGTPRLAGRFLPHRVLASLGGSDATGGEDGESDPEAYLVEIDVLHEGGSADDLVIDDGFEGAWFDRIRAIDRGTGDADVIGALLDVEDERLAVDRHGDAFVARVDGRRVGQWESSAALVADVAADEFLAALDRGWRDRSPAFRSRALGVLRLRLERCPRCDGPVAVGEDAVESCCRPVETVAVTCRDCDSRLFEPLTDPAAVAAA